MAAKQDAKRLDALSAMASDIGAGFKQMQASAAEVRQEARVHQKAAPPAPEQPSSSSLMYLAGLQLHVVRVFAVACVGRCLAGACWVLLYAFGPYE